MSHWLYAIGHWPDVTLFLAVARPFPWKDVALAIGLPALTLMGSIYVSTRVSEKAIENTDKDVGILRSRIEINTRIIESDHAAVLLLVRRAEQMEARHDEIMNWLLNNARVGSGYTYIPEEIHGRAKKAPAPH